MQYPKETARPVHDREARRRKLLRVGTAAPMVLTLRPGASFAASVLCTQRMHAADQARAEAAEKLSASSDADEWVRAQVDIVELQRTDLDAVDLADARVDGQYVLGTDGHTYWRVDSAHSGMGPLIASTKSTPRLSDDVGIGGGEPVSVDYNTSNTVATVLEKRWALIKVNPDTGEPLGYSWEPKALSGVAVSMGCFASLNPGVARYDGGFGGIASFVKRVLGLG